MGDETWEVGDGVRTWRLTRDEDGRVLVRRTEALGAADVPAKAPESDALGDDVPRDVRPERAESGRAPVERAVPQRSVVRTPRGELLEDEAAPADKVDADPVEEAEAALEKGTSDEESAVVSADVIAGVKRGLVVEALADPIKSVVVREEGEDAPLVLKVDARAGFSPLGVALLVTTGLPKTSCLALAVHIDVLDARERTPEGDAEPPQESE